MTTANQKKLGFERLKKMASNGHVYDALKELEALAKRNNLDKEVAHLAKIKENLRYLDAHLMDDSFGKSAWKEEIFELLDLIDDLETREYLEVNVQTEKTVNLILDNSLGLNEEKKTALVKTLAKMLGVNRDNIGIEQMAVR